MNKHFILAGLLSLAIISPSFADDTIIADNAQKNIQNKTQVQKEFSGQKNNQQNFYGNQKEQAVKNVNEIKNDAYKKVNNNKPQMQRPQQPKQEFPKNINNRNGQRPPQFGYEHRPQMQFAGNHHNPQFDRRYPNMPNNRFQNARGPQDLRRNGNFQHYRGCNNMAQRPYPRNHNQIKKG